MGWWKDGDDLLGDGPADLFQEGLTEFGAEYGKPGWQQVLDALESALDVGRLHAVFAPGAPELWSDGKRADAALGDALRNLFDQIREEYQERRGRKPTVSEILGTVHFSLAGRPESFLAAPPIALKKLQMDKPS